MELGARMASWRDPLAAPGAWAVGAPHRRAVHVGGGSGATLDAVLGVCCDALGVPTVSGGDNFFASGGTSLSAIQISARLADELGFAVPIRLLFDAPDFAAFAHEIDQLRSPGDDPAAAVEREPVAGLARAQAVLDSVEALSDDDVAIQLANLHGRVPP
jgi:hypothetical protein